MRSARSLRKRTICKTFKYHIIGTFHLLKRIQCDKIIIERKREKYEILPAKKI